MSGKVFPKSANLIEDQASVLFDYLSQAAKKIVTEEMRLEGEIATRKEELVQTEHMIVTKSRAMSMFFVAAGVVLVAALAVAIFMSFLTQDGTRQHAYWALLLLPAGLAIVGITTRSARDSLRDKTKVIKTSIVGFGQEYTAIRRDYAVHKLGIAYVPVATRVPFEGKSFLLDHTGLAQNQEFNLYMVKDQTAFIKTVKDLEDALIRIPLVEGSTAVEEVSTGEYSRSIQNVTYYDYLGGLDRSMRTAAFHLNNLEHQSVSMPVIDPKSQYAAFLKEHGTTEPANGQVVTVFSTDAHTDALKNFEALYEMKKAMEGRTAQFEEFLQDLMSRMASTIQKVTSIKTSSANQLVEHANRILFTSLKSAYNHYSPQLEAEEIERIRGERFDFQESVESYKPFDLKHSSLVRYDVASGNWVSEDGRRTSFPFGVHQIHEEIVAPIVQNLMNETRIERLKIYNAIKDQKIDYLNQWHRDTDDFYGRNRAQGAELINLMQRGLTEFMAALNQYESFEETQKSMGLSNNLEDAVINTKGLSGLSVFAYKEKTDQFRAIQDEFNDYVDRLKEEIDRRAEEFGYIEYFDASLRDKTAKAFAASMTNMDALDDRRKTLLGINAFFATAAELPPQPDVDNAAIMGMNMSLGEVANEVRRTPRASTPATRTGIDADLWPSINTTDTNSTKTTQAGMGADRQPEGTDWIPPPPPSSEN